ncbi:restriction endonuclease subunit S [Salinivibrio kushneri]|uniref:Type I restriction modification DNA specificity domain-containing protein n=1 Tax=Salinivibrio kushneri TaxID=1908198 RepID=A0AB36K6I0_9GAMM|nr:restriction endonuclease subunit S [Salinivibrio kushneri]OOE44257.1 hypothetical protein BZG09_07980 [Salinivibrio kushneri]
MIWTQCKLSEVATLIRGITFSKAEGVDSPEVGRVPVIRAGSIQKTLLVNDGQIWVPEEKVKPHQFIRKNDILMCTSSGSSDLVGKCAKSDANYDISFGAFCAGIRPDLKKVSPSYLYHFLNSPKFKNWTKKSSGANIKNIRASELAEFKIPLPPLDEQKRIAAILDKADAIRQKRKQAIELADEFLRSVFLNMFGDPVTNPKGWEICELKDCLDFLTSGSRGWAKYYTEEGSKFIRIQNVGKNKLLLNELAHVNAPVTREAERTRVKVNDVLLSITADLGRSAVVTEDLSGGYINQHLALLRVKTKKLEPQFLSALLSSKGALRQFKAKNKAAVKAGLNFDDIRTFEVYLPPLRTQAKYLSTYNATMKNLNSLRIQHDNAEAFFSSLSQKAFSGKL